MIFELEDRIWNVALVDLRPGTNRAEAAKELVRLAENVGDQFSAHKILRDLPKSIKVKGTNLEEFKKLFDTQEYFHHQRVVGLDHKVENRTIWVTLRDPDANPENYFALMSALIRQPPWDKVLLESQIILKNGVVITLDKEPV